VATAWLATRFEVALMSHWGGFGALKVFEVGCCVEALRRRVCLLHSLAAGLLSRRLCTGSGGREPSRSG